MVNTLYLPELREMLAESDSAGLKEFCTALHPARTVEFMEGLSGREAWAVLKHADPSTRAGIFQFLDRQKQIEIFETQDREEIATLIGDLAPDDRVDLLDDVRPWIVEELAADSDRGPAGHPAAGRLSRWDRRRGHDHGVRANA